MVDAAETRPAHTTGGWEPLPHSSALWAALGTVTPISTHVVEKRINRPNQDHGCHEPQEW